MKILYEGSGREANKHEAKPSAVLYIETTPRVHCGPYTDKLGGGLTVHSLFMLGLFLGCNCQWRIKSNDR